MHTPGTQTIHSPSVTESLCVVRVSMMYTPGTHSISSTRAIAFMSRSRFNVSICVLCTLSQYDVYPRYVQYSSRPN